MGNELGSNRSGRVSYPHVADTTDPDRSQHQACVQSASTSKPKSPESQVTSEDNLK
jgi:hypothetical protein